MITQTKCSKSIKINGLLTKLQTIPLAKQAETDPREKKKNTNPEQPVSLKYRTSKYVLPPQSSAKQYIPLLRN